MFQLNLMNKKKVIQHINKVFFLITVFAISPALTAAPILQIDGSGLLTGAKNVDVNGTLFDVSLSDGSCVDQFSGCNDTSDFLFSTVADAEAAMLALLAEIPSSFSNDPSTINGCPIGLSANQCIINLPFAVNPGNAIVGPQAEVLIGIVSPTFTDVLYFSDGVTPNTGFIDINDALEPRPFNDSFFDNNTYAVFSIPSSNVPEPAAIVLFFFGLLGIGAMRLKA
jgi:hypothetical protein